MSVHETLLAAAGRTRLALSGGSIRSKSGCRLWLDPEDRRAQLLAAYRGELDRSVIAAWRRVVARMAPTLVLDIGANYGEVLLAATYPHGARVHAFEPSPAVAHHLRRSIANGLPTATLHELAAGDEDGLASLVVNPKSSGLTSVRRNGDGPTVSVRRIDRLVAADSTDMLAFKLDVEGGEPAALRGMQGLFTVVDSWVGICEIEHLDNDFLDKVASTYAASAITTDGRMVPIPDAGLRSLAASTAVRKAHGLAKDIVLASDMSVIERLR